MVSRFRPGDLAIGPNVDTHDYEAYSSPEVLTNVMFPEESSGGTLPGRIESINYIDERRLQATIEDIYDSKISAMNSTRKFKFYNSRIIPL